MSASSDAVAELLNSLPNDRAELLKLLLEEESRKTQIIPRHLDKPGVEPIALRASLAQQRLWLLSQLDDGASRAYHLSNAFVLRGHLETPALRDALNQIVARHEGLRTRFIAREGVPYQEPLPPEVGLTLRTESISECASAGDRALRLQRIMLEEASASFDLSGGHLARARLIDLSGHEHVLQITMHHIVTDGWSMAVFFRELWELYSASCLGRPPSLEPLSIQYRDYALWQQRGLATGELQPHTKYWQGALAGAPAALTLLTDHPRPVTPSHAGSHIPVTLSPQLTDDLRALSRRHGATLYMTVLATWAALLARLSGQDEVVVGTPVSNRTRAQVLPLIGLFVNTLPIRVDTSSDPSTSELLSRVKRQVIDAQAHADLPFDHIVQVINPERAYAKNPLFQVMLAWEGAPGSHRVEITGLDISPLPVPIGTAQFDMQLTLRESNAGITGAMSYATALFEPETIKRHIGFWQTLLGRMVADPDKPVSTLEIWPVHEREQLIERFNATAASYPQERCLHELFEAQVRRTPEAVAVIYEGQSLTYAQLNARANQLAHYLRERGVGADDLVGVCVERSLWLVVGLMGVLKAGGAYVPLDPGYPPERLGYMLGDAEPKVLLTQQSVRGSLPQCAAQLVSVDEQWEQIAQHSPENLGDIGLTPSHLAYVIYTSGSTGAPKGAMNEHRAVVNRLHWMQERYGLSAEDRVLQKTPFSFDVSVWEFFWTLMSGARLIIARPEGHKDPSYLSELISQTGVTRVHFVPSMLQGFLEQCRSEECASLRQVVCSGEELSGALVRRCLESLPQVRLSNLYGPTEAAIDVTAWECGAEGEGTRVPIGRPIANIQIYILDAHGQPVPVGVSGEIYIAGVGVGRGYLNRPELTAERFVRDPFSADDAARMYRTGDVGRWRADGVIEYLGRNDQQVKIRGYRIELGEIESQLVQHPGVKAAVVLAREDAPGEKRLVAYVVGHVEESGTAVLTPEALRTHLQQRLPEYMVPAAYVALEQLPLTANGKVDRKGLPAPQSEDYNRAVYAPPLGEVEEILAGIWQELLQVQRVGRHDNFFELGGHSLLIVQLLERLRRVGLSVDVRDARRVFDSRSLSEMASELLPAASTHVPVPANLIPAECEKITPAMLPLVSLESEHIDRIIAAVPGGARNIQDIYPLAPLQEGIFFHHLIGEKHGKDAYVLQALLSISTREDLDDLISALQAVIDRHDVLRTAVLWEGLPQPLQVVHRMAQLPVETFAIAPGTNLRQLHEVMRPERWQLPLTRAPIMRLHVAPVPQTGSWYALVQIHHIIEDARSLATLVSEVVAHLQGREQLLPEPVPYRDHVAQALFLASKHDAKNFFSAKLGDVEETTAPFGLTNVHGDGTETERSTRRLPVELARKIRAQARNLNISVATLFHAAWALVVAHTSGRDDVIFGTVLLGRLQSGTGTHRQLGMFINTLPLRIVLRGKSAKSLVEQTQRDLVDLLTHEQAPLAVAQRCSGIRGAAPLFTSIVNFRHSMQMQGSSWNDAPGVSLLGTWDRTNYPISLSVDDTGHDLCLIVQTDRSTNPARIVTYTATVLHSLLEVLESAPQTPALDISILPNDERSHVLEKFNATDVDYSPNLLSHELFEAQVERTPKAVAIAHNGRMTTYAELNLRANQLAHLLRGNGVGPEQLVAVYLERGLDLIVAVLGVLKAGGAYVLLDPDYPPGRLAYMVADAVPTVIVTQQKLRASLPGTTGRVVDIDTDQSHIAERSTLNLKSDAIGLDPQSLAYVIYTSGSTGEPKGVMLAHAGLSNLSCMQRQTLGVGSRSRVLQFASPSFDAFTWEWAMALCSGAQLHMVSRDDIQPGEPLLRTLSAARITHATLPPSAVSALPVTDGLELEVLVVAGEACSASIAEKWAHGRRFINAYGPTEATVCATMYECISQERSGVPIGSPIANTRVYILNSHADPVPVDAVGEVYIAGVGVARGYLNQPSLTAECFLPVPFRQDTTARMYRTGDFARWRSDGTIEFVGRSDQQVKIRGYRIELGEIEALLQRHPGVQDAVVLARESSGADDQLVAYVAASLQTLPFDPGDRDKTMHLRNIVDEWAEVYDQLYCRQLPGLEPSFAGWNSTYTGLAIPDLQMDEWLGHTIASIAEQNPRRVLEIGCGTGLIVKHLADRCTEYVATDFSAPVVDRLQEWTSSRPDLQHVQVLRRAADDLDDLRTGQFDTVILNSVIQYFPDVNYLLRVLEGVVRLVETGGRIFLGDVRNLRLLEVFHSSVQLKRASPNIKVSQLRRRIWRAMEEEKELLVDPEFFTALAGRLRGIAAAQVKLKRGVSSNELTCYRYDVVLQIGAQGVASSAEEKCDWSTSVGSLVELRDALRRRRWASVRICAIPNGRIALDVAGRDLIRASHDTETVAKLLHLLSGQPPVGVDPEACYTLAREYGYDVSLDWAKESSPGSFTLILSSSSGDAPSLRASLMNSGDERPWHSYTNSPVQNQARQRLIPALQPYLAQKLPHYMLPSVWIALAELPQTVNGKVDRHALRALDVEDYRQSEYEEPRGDAERTLAAAWERTLHIERVGRNDNFFELGGHSLLAVKLRATFEEFGTHLQLSELFQYPILKDLALHILRTANYRKAESQVELMRRGREGSRPLFVVHTITGEATPLRHLARAVDQEVPVYALQLLEPRSAGSIQAIAAQHVRSAKSVQAKGPFRIVGHCFGGIVAYEMARQLVEAGEQVSFVGLIDTAASVDAMQLEPLTDLVDMQREISPSDPGWHLLQRWLDNADACRRAQKSYEVKDAPVPVYLFTAEAESDARRHADEWRRTLGDRLRVLTVPGDHFSIVVEPHVGRLGELLSVTLRAQD